MRSREDIQSYFCKIVSFRIAKLVKCSNSLDARGIPIIGMGLLTLLLTPGELSVMEHCCPNRPQPWQDN